MNFLTFHFEILIILILKSKVINCWNLNSLGIGNDTYKLKHVSVYYNKSYLSIEIIANPNLYKLPTLIESSWPEKLNTKNKIFPSINMHALDDKNCNYIQQSGWSYADGLNRLWVLDMGNAYCKPKILIYNLFVKIELHRIICLHFNYNDITSVAAEPVNNSKNVLDISLYFTLTNGKHILLFNLLKNQWKRIYFSFDNPNYLRTSKNDLVLINLKIIGIAFDQKNFEMYIIDYFGKIYTTNYEQLKNQTEVPVKYLGELLGKPKLIIDDNSGNLYYNLPQYGSILKCNLKNKKDLSAENHQIVQITNDNLQQLILDKDGRLWYIKSYTNQIGLHCRQVQNSF